MKLNGKDISSLTDEQIIASYGNCLKAEAERNAASSHEKFTKSKQIGNRTIPKMDFAPPNPAFVELKQELLNEIKNRKLDITNVYFT